MASEGETPFHLPPGFIHGVKVTTAHDWTPSILGTSVADVQAADAIAALMSEGGNDPDDDDPDDDDDCTPIVVEGK